MIFKEIFYENNQPQNIMLSVRQAGELLCDPDYLISRSNSPTHTAGYLKSCRLFLEYNGNKYSVCEGQSIFLPAYFSYSIYSDRLSPPHFLWINLRGQLIDTVSQALFSDSFALSSYDFSSDMPLIKKFISEESEAFHEISSVIFKIISGIYSSKLNPEKEKGDLSDFESYISNSIQSGFSVSEMAKHFHCSEDTLSRHFKEQYSVTLYKYYQNVRIQIAKSMLEKTEFTIEDIAQRLHFSNRNHFSLSFKKATGMSPAEYKKNKNA